MVEVIGKLDGEAESIENIEVNEVENVDYSDKPLKVRAYSAMHLTKVVRMDDFKVEEYAHPESNQTLVVMEHDNLVGEDERVHEVQIINSATDHVERKEMVRTGLSDTQDLASSWGKEMISGRLD